MTALYIHIDKETMKVFFSIVFIFALEIINDSRAEITLDDLPRLKELLTSKKKIGPKTVYGSWSEWSQWTQCSPPDSCGSKMGTRNATRTCTNPAPPPGTFDCFGRDFKEQPCWQGPCPQDGHWSQWSDWSHCPSPITTDSQKHRSRTCNHPEPKFGGSNCIGPADENDSCLAQGFWGQWTEWTTCPEIPAPGDQRQRSRSCDGGGSCSPGLATETEECSQSGGGTPVNGAWTEWTTPSCPADTCPSSGSTTVTKTRECTNPAPMNGGTVCPGSNTENFTCPTATCSNRGMMIKVGQGKTIFHSFEIVSGQLTVTQNAIPELQAQPYTQKCRGMTVAKLSGEEFMVCGGCHGTCKSASPGGTWTDVTASGIDSLHNLNRATAAQKGTAAVWITGGHGSEEVGAVKSRSTFIYDFNSGVTAGPDLEMTLSHHCMLSLDGNGNEFFFAGGETTHANTNQDEILGTTFTYSFDGGTYTSMAALNTARTLHACTLHTLSDGVQTKVVAGGVSLVAGLKETVNSAEYYQASSGSWVTMGPLSTYTNRAALWSQDNTLYYFGGCDAVPVAYDQFTSEFCGRTAWYSTTDMTAWATFQAGAFVQPTDMYFVTRF